MTDGKKLSFHVAAEDDLRLAARRAIMANTILVNDPHRRTPRCCHCDRTVDDCINEPIASDSKVLKPMCPIGVLRKALHRLEEERGEGGEGKKDMEEYRVMVTWETRGAFIVKADSYAHAEEKVRALAVWPQESATTDIIEYLRALAGIRFSGQRRRRLQIRPLRGLQPQDIVDDWKSCSDCAEHRRRAALAVADGERRARDHFFCSSKHAEQAPESLTQITDQSQTL